jgi:O-acetyl-ADP-ribose deacetylase (regulator of RNase III)
VTVHVPVLIVAAVFLGLSLFYMSGDMTRFSPFQRQARVSFIWLCAALASTLVIFSFFPETAMSGQAFGFSLGGAAAFVLVILLAAPSLQRKIADLDHASPDQESPPALKSPRYLTAQEVFYYGVKGTKDKSVRIITSNLIRVTGVDVWVNSENTFMRMSDRFHETISGAIRFYGAERDTGGHIVRDLIANELSDKVAGKAPVQPAVAISTGPGHLRESNNVRAIIHVAAVQIGEDLTRLQLQAIDTCVFNVLREAERLAAELDPPIRSVIFPLFGTGSGRGDRESTARMMVDAVADYLRHHEGSGLCDIYFSARTNLTLEALQLAAKGSPDLEREKERSAKSKGQK